MKIIKSVSIISFISVFALLSLVAAPKSLAQVGKKSTPSAKANAAEPISTDAPVQIEIPPHLRKKGGTLRIRNLTTGKEAVLTLSDEEFISSDVVRKLTDSTSKLFVPEFSVLDSIRRTGSSRSPFDPSQTGYRNNAVSTSLVFNQPIWRTVPFALQKRPDGGTKIFIDTKQSAVVLSPQQAAARRDLKEDAGIKKMFDAGFAALEQKRYDVSLEAFERIMDKKDRLSEVQLRQAAMGRGISRFHQKGCESVTDDFKIADQDSKNFDDISYYRALCFVEAKRYEDAGGLFRELARKQSPVYAEQARFYVGVVSENLENYDEAEAAYLDTIDFASDQRVVALAKERVEIVRRLRAERNYENKWFGLALVGGLGYDSNVIALPQGFDPSQYSVSSASSLSYLGVGSFEFKPRISNRIDNRYRYTFVGLHYANSDVATSSDLQSHDATVALDFSRASGGSWGVSGGYNLVYLGPIASSVKYLATTSVEAHWSRLHGTLEAPTGDTTWGFKVGLARPQTAAASAETDATANSYLASWRYNSRKKPPNVWGPGVDLEYRPSSGVDNSYAAITLLGTWLRPVGSEKWGLLWSQEAAIQDTNYYERTSAKRNDIVLKYTTAISRVWWERVETKLQFVGTYSTSNVSTYKYSKAQLNLLVSSSF